MRGRGFTLVELLVVIGVIATLLGLMLPALGAARESGRAVVCLSNLRQAGAACRMWAQEHGGEGPNIGWPWGSVPNWALVVQDVAGRDGYSPESVLVCPEHQSRTAQELTRTYAMNATGQAGQPGDARSFDSPENPGRHRFDLIRRPSETPLLMDSAASPTEPGLPPPSRTYSVIDFRQTDHVEDRLARIHADDRRFHVARFDGSAGAVGEVDPRWAEPLP
jgi:prepilin-type N-terminal cleavage/methylation domain-containing protein